MASNKTSSTKTSKATRKKQKPKLKRMVFWSFIAASAAAFVAMVVYLFVIINGENLLKSNISKMEMAESSIIYDRNEEEMTRLSWVNRELVSLEDVPENLKNAFIATEDQRFEEHDGIDYWAIGRALVKDIINRSAVEGGSTITQQLVKNMFLSHEKTIFRKAQEASIAVAMENKFSKDEILEMYLNQIYFGKGVYGIKAASKKYFNKSDLNDLELWEMASLAAIPKAPNSYNPLSNPDASKKRRSVVLALMEDQKYITKEEQQTAASVDYVIPVNAEVGDEQYLTVRDYVVQEAISVSGISEEDFFSKGYKIYTSIDINAQREMNVAFQNDSLFPKNGKDQAIQGSMVILDNNDGGIIAMIGGRDYVAKGLNRVQVKRQPGSSFKPLITFAPALESGNWNPHSLLKDEKMSFGKYSPRNYDNQYLGEVSMYDAVKYSKNIPAVWLLNEIGITTGMNFVKKLGIELGSNDRNLSIALGGLTEGVTPLQMAKAYSAFPNHGVMKKEHSIRKIVDSSGEEVYSFEPETTRVMSKETAWYSTLLMRKVVESGGTGVAAAMNRPVAGKTGSTQVGIQGINSGNRDVWFVGYTPEWTAAVWMGFDKTDKNNYMTSGSGLPAKMFSTVLTKALSGHKVTAFQRPDDVQDPEVPVAAVSDLTAQYDANNGEVSLSWTALDPKYEYQLFRKGTEESEFTLIFTDKVNSVKDYTVGTNITYEYYVVVRDPKTELTGPPSNIVSVVVPGASEGLEPEDENDDWPSLPNEGEGDDYPGLPEQPDQSDSPDDAQNQ